MAAKCSIAPDILWNWIIEALANFEQVDVHTLIGLVKMAPAISGDAGEDAREVVSLRILESLFSRDNEAIVNADASQKDKISFDASERCEDVLKKILHETPEHVGKLEKVKWDVRPFIMHKRSSLPKCSLKKLKEVILESRHPLIGSLKQASKLVISNVSEDINPVIDDVHGTLAIDDLALNSKQDENKIQENVLQEADQVEKSIGGTTEHAGSEDSEIVTEHPLEETSGNILIKRYAHADSKHDQQHLHYNDDIVPHATCKEGHIIEHDVRHETTTSSEKAIDERADVATQKEAFLNSQVTLTQDSLSMNELSEIDLCMKCNEGGQLLVCSSESCVLRVHENCLGFDVTLEENEDFFCPFCAYSRAISEYLEAKRKASLARKDLEAFSGFRIKRIPNKSKKPRELEKNETETTEGNGNENTANRANINYMSGEEGSAQPDPLIPVVNDDVHIETGSLNTQTTEFLPNPIPKASALKQRSKEKENQWSTESSFTQRLRKRKAQYIAPPLPSLRRKILSWTKSEEEMLKEGVKRYSGDISKGIPWKEILYFGRNVFHKGRTSIDLKDKWRNISKGNSNLK